MNSLKDKKHIFFDLDDTLWDFENNSAYVLEGLFKEFELEQKLNTNFDAFLEEYKKVNLQFWSLYNKRQIDKAFLRNQRFHQTFQKFNYENYEENIIITELYLKNAPHGKKLKAGCLETLSYLKENYKLHIITNGFKEIQGIKIDGCGLRHFFDQIIISEEHQMSKPDVKLFRLAETLAKTKSEACVMIGDNYESDIKGALDAGWQAIHFSEKKLSGYNGKHIKRLEDLKNLF